MTLLELLENAVAHRLERRDDEEAAEPCKLVEAIAVPKDVLHLRRDVEGDVGVLCVELTDDRHRVADAVQEVRIAEGDVTGADGDLLLGVGEDDLARHDEDRPSYTGVIGQWRQR